MAETFTIWVCPECRWHSTDSGLCLRTGCGRFDNDDFPMGEVQVVPEARVAELEAALRDVLDWAAVMPGFHQEETVSYAQHVLKEEEAK
jgi:hypothetical protein